MDDRELRRKERILAGYREYEITYQVSGKITIRGVMAESRHEALKEARCVMSSLSHDWRFNEHAIHDVSLPGEPVRIFKQQEDEGFFEDDEDLYDIVVKEPMILTGPSQASQLTEEEKKNG